MNTEYADATTRALSLLSRLEGRTLRPAGSLAAELGVTPRTIRRDIARLRDLGYPIDTVRGDEGGYRIAPGAVLPPVRLTRPEAVTCALALADPPDSLARDHAQSALAKIRSALPDDTRHSTDAILAASHRVVVDDALRPDAAPADVAVLGALARARLQRRRIQFTYGGRSSPSLRRVDAHALVCAARRWYLVGYDTDADTDAATEPWRTFRVDRISGLELTDVPATDRGGPAEDLDAWATSQLAAGWQQVRAVVRAHAPASTVRRAIAAAWGTVEAESDTSCILRVGAGSYAKIASWLMVLDADLEVVEPDELRDAFARLADRARVAADR